jgi:hypothetical protein
LSEVQPSLAALREAVQLACQPTTARLIEEGRRRVLAMPRGWVVEHIGPVAEQALDLSDYWEYRRLLELLSRLDATLVQQFSARGLTSSDPDVREASEDFSTGRDAPGTPKE